MDNTIFFKNNIYIEYNNIDSIKTLLNSKTFLELNEYFYNNMPFEISGLSDARFQLGSFMNLYKLFENVLLSNDYIIDKNIISGLLRYILSFRQYWNSLKKFLFISSCNSSLQSEAMYASRRTMDLFFGLICEACGKKADFHYFYKNNGFDSIVSHNSNSSELTEYSNIENVQNMVTVTPFMCNTFSNTRSGLFSETNHEISLSLIKNPNEWLQAGFKIGKLNARVFINKLFINHLIGLSILFESLPGITKEYDLILFFGIEDKELDGKIYTCSKTGIIFGAVQYNKKNDYFGYMKKMLLTMHNIYFIKRKQLPIHGAMVKVTLINGCSYNIVIVGDSGAGKSESLEAFRSISGNVLKNMTVIFDDMGV